jgi:hypothetical protein
MRAVLFGLLQLAGGLGAALALYHLIGLWLAVLIVSLVVLVGATAAEAVAGPSLRQRRISRALKRSS